MPDRECTLLQMIVTTNIRDYRRSPINALTPAEALKVLGSR